MRQTGMAGASLGPTHHPHSMHESASGDGGEGVYSVRGRGGTEIGQRCEEGGFERARGLLWRE